MTAQGVNHEKMEERVGQIANSLASLEGSLLPILHAVQTEFGCIPKAGIPIIAEVLNLSRAEVHGVVSFYHDFREDTAGRHVIKICRAEACQSMGGDELAERLLAALGLDWHQTRTDGLVTVEPVYCLGLCACAPALMLNGNVRGRLNGDHIGEIVSEVSQ